MVKVKVCGLTSYEDAALALAEGVDALGFNFYKRSPRYIKPAEARSIIRRLPPFTATVGVFVNVSDPAEVTETACVAGVQILQLHGDESPEYCRQLSDWTLIKAVRPGKDFTPASLTGYAAQAFLLDTKDDFLFGGTGKTSEWSLAAGIKRLAPIILAGGLHAGNVGEAIRTVLPYGVDVCSGVENSPGKKDSAKLREFMREVGNVIRDF
ncbi:MAG TPA: phosphoribosylanthranilate isomerase [Acidobacteriota bacterium]|nr:phosphoribosylanthranilate isomerase [Acidobacteriota bacterium]